VQALIGPAALRVDEVAAPTRPTGDAVRIAVHAAGIGFVDTLVSRGKYQVRQEPPFTPGMEVSGVIVEVPDGVDLSVGQAVTATVPVGGAAETVWAASHLVAPLAHGLTHAEGAAMVVNYHTAVVALTRRAALRAGETVLVHGAGGGLGSACVQVAAALGARVIAVAGTPERRELARSAGADDVYGPDEWFEAVRGQGGVGVIVDPVGGDVFDQSVRCIASEGRLLTMGYTSGRIPTAPANRLLLRNAGVLGVNWLALLEADHRLFGRTAQQLAELIAAGMRPVPPVQYQLADAVNAFRDLEARRIAGKAVIVLR
jgi:NADPH2:quinone reductase